LKKVNSSGIFRNYLDRYATKLDTRGEVSIGATWRGVMRVSANAAICGLIAVVLISTCADAAAADKTTVSSAVNLVGFNSTIFATGFQSTDLGDSPHSCSTENNSSCSVKHGYTSEQVNIHEFLCIPAGTTYQLTATCKTLLNTGVGACHTNEAGDACKGGQGIGPVCQWRTGAPNPQWTWTVSYSSSPPYQVDCSQTGYVDVH
jgi:hypothetical protein